MVEWGDRGFVDVSGDKLSQLSKELFFSFGLVCGRDLEIWVRGVSVVAAKSKLGCWGFFWKGNSISGAPLASIYSFFVKDLKS